MALDPFKNLVTDLYKTYLLENSQHNIYSTDFPLLIPIIHCCRCIDSLKSNKLYNFFFCKLRSLPSYYVNVKNISIFITFEVSAVSAGEPPSLVVL